MNWANLEFNRRTLLKIGSAAAVGSAFVLAGPAVRAKAVPTPTAAEIEARALALQPPAFLFETAMPPHLEVEPGSEVSISSEQAIIGKSSLKWDFTSGAVRINAPLDAASSRTASDDPALLGSRSTLGLWIYSGTPRNDTLRFEFGRDGGKDAWCDVTLDFVGWRTVWIRLSKDLHGTPRRDMDTLRILAPANGAGTLYLDQLVLNMSMRTDHPSRDLQAPFVNPEGDTAQNAHWLALMKYYQLQEANVPTVESSPALLSDLQELKDKYVGSYLTNAAKVTDAGVAELSRQLSGLGIPERSVTGPATPVFTFQQAIFPPEIAGDLTVLAAATPLRKVTDLMQSIAKAWYRGSPAQRILLGELYVRAVVHLRRVGWTHGSCQGTIHHLGYNVRGYYDSVYLMRDVLRGEGLLESVREDIDWMAGPGRMMEQPVRQDGMADIFNTNVRGLLAACLLRETPGEQAAMVAVLREYLNQALLPSNGLIGGLKPDGSCFHHGGFYPAYGSDGFAGLTPIVAVMSGGRFRISPAAHAWLKKSVLLMRTYANELQWALTVCNRHPTGTDTMKVQSVQWLLQAGTPDGSKALDPDVGAAFLRLLPAAPNSIQKALASQLAAAGVAAEAPPAGNWTFNYGALNVHRRHNWSVTVRGHNRYLWSTEIYVADNIYGRYATYGQIAIQSQGDPVNNLDSGFSHDGWDWGRFPGTTAIRKPVEQLRTDLGAGAESLVLTDSRFGGAGSIDGRNGMFAMDLHEAPVYDPSHRARKSVFFFDDRVVALGTAIENNDGSNETATTLFQSHLGHASQPSYLNATTPISDFPFAVAPAAASRGTQWLADGKGNGYYLPRGQRLGLERSNQQSRDQGTGQPTNGDFATAWLSHGTKPKNASYEYALLVGKTPEETAAFATAMAGSEPPYAVLEASRKRHIVFDRATGITAYALFDAGNGFPKGSIEGSDTPALIMTRSEGSGLALSVTDPDLRLYDGVDHDQYDAKGNFVGGVLPTETSWSKQPSQSHMVSVRVRGSWRLGGPVNGVQVREGGATTEVTVETKDGLPVQFVLQPSR